MFVCWTMVINESRMNAAFTSFKRDLQTIFFDEQMREKCIADESCCKIFPVGLNETVGGLNQCECQLPTNWLVR